MGLVAGGGRGDGGQGASGWRLGSKTKLRGKRIESIVARGRLMTQISGLGGVGLGLVFSHGFSFGLGLVLGILGRGGVGFIILVWV